MSFDSILVRLKGGRGDYNPTNVTMFRFHTGSIKSEDDTLLDDT